LWVTRKNRAGSREEGHGDLPKTYGGRGGRSRQKVPLGGAHNPGSKEWMSKMITRGGSNVGGT